MNDIFLFYTIFWHVKLLVLELLEHPSYLIIYLTNEHFEYGNRHSITLYMYITTIFLIKTVKMNTFAPSTSCFLISNKTCQPLKWNIV